jgi:crossover junction endodeoxyribonuclease RusA
MITLSLPYPPSSNRLWRAANGRNIKSAEYRKWEKASIAHLIPEGRLWPVVSGPYSIVYTAQRPDNRRRDIANIEKAASDMLQNLGVIADDCNCQSVTVQWASGEPVGKSALVHVEITPRMNAPRPTPERLPNVCDPDPKVARSLLVWWPVFSARRT